MNLKRYLLFAYSSYYPHGGWNDFLMSLGDREEAEDAARRLTAEDTYGNHKFENAHVVDGQTGEVIARRTAA